MGFGPWTCTSRDKHAGGAITAQRIAISRNAPKVRNQADLAPGAGGLAGVAPDGLGRLLIVKVRVRRATQPYDPVPRCAAAPSGNLTADFSKRVLKSPLKNSQID